MPYTLNLERRLVCQALQKVFNISSTTSWVVQEVLSTIAILSAVTVKRLAVEQKVKQKYFENKVTNSILIN